jgi:RimJ/RimL family protein N-acetyltransferase
MTTHDISLVGPEVRLDPLELSDADKLWPLIDDELWRGIPTPCPTSVKNYREHIEAQHQVPALHAFTVRDASSGEVRGSTAFYDVVPTQKRVEIGWTWYARPFWGRKTNPASKLLLLTYAFEALDFNRVALRCDIRNTRSARAIERLGAKPEGVLRQHRIAADGVVSDTAYFSIVRHEWPMVRDGLKARMGERVE